MEGGAARTRSSGSLGSPQISVGGHAPRLSGLDPSCGVPPPPFSGAGFGPQGGARSLRSRQRAGGAGGNSSCSPRCPAGSGGCESGGWRLAFLQSPLCPLQRRTPHLHSRVRAATLTVGEQRREAEQGGAAAARHPWGHGRGWSGKGPRGQQSSTTWPQAGLGHIQLRVAAAPECLC